MKNKLINFIFIFAMIVLLLGIIVIIIMPNPIFPDKPTYTPVVSPTATNSPQPPTTTPTTIISPTLIIPTPTKPEITLEPTVVTPTPTSTPIIYTPLPPIPTIEYAVIKACDGKYWYQTCHPRCCPFINEYIREK